MLPASFLLGPFVMVLSFYLPLPSPHALLASGSLAISLSLVLAALFLYLSSEGKEITGRCSLHFHVLHGFAFASCCLLFPVAFSIEYGDVFRFVWWQLQCQASGDVNGE
jgi:hypothetical protein